MNHSFGRHRSIRKVKVQRTKLSAKYDAAQTNSDNAKHWANADALSPNAATNSTVRATLRNRARYEVANNSYASGIVRTLANDVVGTGPRLQMLSQDIASNQVAEQLFREWSDEIGLPQKLRLIRAARVTDGEIFGILIINKGLRGPVKLDIKLVEPERITTPLSKQSLASLSGDDVVDGIEYDSYGNPAYYYVSNNSGGSMSGTVTYKRLPSKNIIHWYSVDRPGQSRGVPEITPALPLFAQLRRYTGAVIAAAETAADFAAVLYTDSPANGESDDVEPMDVIDLEQRMATTLPSGWKLGQVKAEQPVDTYPDFKREILNEIARCLNMPYNIAACNSAGYNYASGRLDHQTYYRTLRVCQSEMELQVLDKIFAEYFNLAMLVSDYMPLIFRDPSNWQHCWFWDGFEHVDPVKEALAKKILLEHGLTTLAREYSLKGLDWRTAVDQQAEELKYMKSKGLVPENKEQSSNVDKKETSRSNE